MQIDKQTELQQQQTANDKRTIKHCQDLSVFLSKCLLLIYFAFVIEINVFQEQYDHEKKESIHIQFCIIITILHCTLLFIKFQIK